MPDPSSFRFVTPPSNYGPPQADFSWLGNLVQNYQQAQMSPLQLQLLRNQVKLQGAQIQQYQDYLQRYGAGAGQPGGANYDTTSDTGTTAEPARSTMATARDPRGKIPVIIAAAQKYGVDPATAVRVAQSEGLASFYGDNGRSGTAFQLYTRGGLGNEFQKETGLDPLDPKNEDAAIDWAMKNVARTGWSPYKGAAKVGIGNRQGIGTPATAARSDQLNATDQAAVDRMYPPQGQSTAQPAPNEEFPGAGAGPPFAPTALTAAQSPNASGPQNIQLANTGGGTGAAGYAPSDVMPTSSAEVAGTPGQGQGTQPAGTPVAGPITPQGRDTVTGQGPSPPITQVAQAAPQLSTTVSGEPDANPAIRNYDRAIQLKQQEAIDLSNYAANPYAGPAAKLRAEQSQNEVKQLQDRRNKLYERLTSERKQQLEEQSSERQKEYGVGVGGRTAIEGALAKRQAEAIEAGGKSTRGAVQTLDAMEDAVRHGGGDITFGPTGEETLKLKEFANSMFPGIFKGVAEAETLKKLNAQLAAEAAKGMTARPSQLEFKTFVANNPGLMTTREGTLALINILRQTKQQDLKLGQLAAANPNPRDWSTIEDRFFADPRNQIISPFTNKPINGQERVPGGAGGAGGNVPVRPSGLPTGSQWSPSRKQWRDPNGRIYDAAGQPLGA